MIALFFFIGSICADKVHSFSVHSFFDLQRSAAWGQENTSPENILSPINTEDVFSPKKTDTQNENLRLQEELRSLQEDVRFLKEKEERRELQQGNAEQEIKTAESTSLNTSLNLPVKTVVPKFNAHLKGRVFFDAINYSPDEEIRDTLGGNIPNSTGFRSVRLGAYGDGYNILNYVLDVEFANSGNTGSVAIKDAFLGIKNVPIFESLTLGNQKIDDGLATYESLATTTMMEHSDPCRVFSLNRRVGILSVNYFEDKKIRWSKGIFYAQDFTGGSTFRVDENDAHGLVFNTRFSFTPYISESDGKIDGMSFLHLGGHWTFINNKNDISSGISERWEGLGSGSSVYQMFNTGKLSDCRYENRFGLEAAAQNGSWGMQSEAFATIYDPQAAPNVQKPLAFGAYIDVRYCLTGQNHRYDQNRGTVGAIIIDEDDFFLTGKGEMLPHLKRERFCISRLGAWELAAHYGYTDCMNFREISVSDKIGRDHDLAFAVNWYLTPQMRTTFQYSHIMVEYKTLNRKTVNGNCDVFGTAFRLSF